MALPDINVVGAIVVAVGEGEWVLGAGGGTQQEDPLPSWYGWRANPYKFHESLTHTHACTNTHKQKMNPCSVSSYSLYM